MKQNLLFIVLFAFLTLPVQAEEAAGPVEVTKAYSYATAPAQKNGAVFMVIHNHQAEDDMLLEARANVSDIVELHTHIMDGDVMMMRKVERYDLPAETNLTLKPRGHHVMLIGLRGPLQAGTHFPLTLLFEKAGEITIEVPVTAPGTAPEHNEHEH